MNIISELMKYPECPLGEICLGDVFVIHGAFPFYREDLAPDVDEYPNAIGRLTDDNIGTLSAISYTGETEWDAPADEWSLDDDFENVWNITQLARNRQLSPELAMELKQLVERAGI